MAKSLIANLQIKPTTNRKSLRTERRNGIAKRLKVIYFQTTKLKEMKEKPYEWSRGGQTAGDPALLSELHEGSLDAGCGNACSRAAHTAGECAGPPREDAGVTGSVSLRPGVRWRVQSHARRRDGRSRTETDWGRGCLVRRDSRRRPRLEAWRGVLVCIWVSATPRGIYRPCELRDFGLGLWPPAPSAWSSPQLSHPFVWKERFFSFVPQAEGGVLRLQAGVSATVTRAPRHPASGPTALSPASHGEGGRSGATPSGRESHSVSCPRPRPPPRGRAPTSLTVGVGLRMRVWGAHACRVQRAPVGTGRKDPHCTRELWRSHLLSVAAGKMAEDLGLTQSGKEFCTHPSTGGAP